MVLAVDGAAVSLLRDQLKGDVRVPTDPDYDLARSIWNGAIDRKRALVARGPSSTGPAQSHVWRRRDMGERR